MPVSSGPEALNSQASANTALSRLCDHDGGGLGVTFRPKGEGFLLVPALVSGTVGMVVPLDVNTVEGAQPC